MGWGSKIEAKMKGKEYATESIWNYEDVNSTMPKAFRKRFILEVRFEGGSYKYRESKDNGHRILRYSETLGS